MSDREEVEIMPTLQQLAKAKAVGELMDADCLLETLEREAPVGLRPIVATARGKVRTSLGLLEGLEAA